MKKYYSIGVSKEAHEYFRGLAALENMTIREVVDNTVEEVRNDARKTIIEQNHKERLDDLTRELKLSKREVAQLEARNEELHHVIEDIIYTILDKKD